MFKIINASFDKSFSDYYEIPNSTFSEIAFVGRSNVGKSSIINDITGRRIAKVSSDPGKTRLINFFLINDLFFFVDLPGYGYAKVSKEVQKSWPKLIENYLEKRVQLKAIIFILDIRRIPNEHDLILSSFFHERHIKTIYILSKADKLSKNEQNKQLQLISKEFKIDKKYFILYSTILKKGKSELLKELSFIIEK